MFDYEFKCGFDLVENETNNRRVCSCGWVNQIETSSSKLLFSELMLLILKTGLIWCVYGGIVREISWPRGSRIFRFPSDSKFCFVDSRLTGCNPTGLIGVLLLIKSAYNRQSHHVWPKSDLNSLPIMRLRKYYDQDDRPQWISCFFCQATKLRIFLTVILMSDLYGVRLDLNGFDDAKCVWYKKNTHTRDQKWVEPWIASPGTAELGQGYSALIISVTLTRHWIELEKLRQH